MASENTLRIRAESRASVTEMPATTRPVSMPRTPNTNRMIYCDTCLRVFAETEGFEGVGGWTVCPVCGMETA